MITVVAIYSALFICQQLLFYIVTSIFYKKNNYGKKHFLCANPEGKHSFYFNDRDIIHTFHAKKLTVFSRNLEFFQYLHVCH